MSNSNRDRSKKQAKSKKPEVFRISLKSHEEVKLREAENPWKPQRAAVPTSDSEEEKSENLYKKVRSVLNKLTPQNFETLVDQVRQLEINTEAEVQTLINLIFEKIVNLEVHEPDYFVVYALMCKELSNMAFAKNSDGVNFRKSLINRCQSEFEKNTASEKSTDTENKKNFLFNLNYEERKELLRTVNIVRFIGELFKQNMLTCKCMFQIIEHLLQHPDEKNLECLCKLLTTGGKVLELKKVDLKEHFQKMQNLTTPKGKLSSRTRFMLLDVIELRANKWVPRRDVVCPKTMDEIKKETEAARVKPRKVQSNKTEAVYHTVKFKPPAMDKLQLGTRHTYQWNQPPKPPGHTEPNKFAFLENSSEPKKQGSVKKTN